MNLNIPIISKATFTVWSSCTYFVNSREPSVAETLQILYSDELPGNFQTDIMVRPRIKLNNRVTPSGSKSALSPEKGGTKNTGIQPWLDECNPFLCWYLRISCSVKRHLIWRHGCPFVRPPAVDLVFLPKPL